MSSQYFNSRSILGAIIILEVAAWGTLKTLGWDTMMALLLSVAFIAVCCAAGVLFIMGLWCWSRRGFRYKTSQLLFLMALLCFVAAGLNKLYVQPYLQRQSVEALVRKGVQLYDLTDQKVGADQIVNDDEVLGLVITNDDMVRSAIPHLGRFPNLEWFILSGDVTDDGLRSLASSRVGHDVALTLWGHKMTDDGLRQLRSFADARSICIDGPAMSHHGLESLVDAGHLKHLVLVEEGPTTRTRVNDASIRPIAGMASVRSLLIAGSGITDASIDVFTQLPDLEKLVLRGTQISSDGKSRLESVLKDCRVSVN